MAAAMVFKLTPTPRAKAGKKGVEHTESSVDDQTHGEERSQLAAYASRLSFIHWLYDLASGIKALQCACKSVVIGHIQEIGNTITSALGS
jgi:hypothetical protein